MIVYKDLRLEVFIDDKRKNPKENTHFLMVRKEGSDTPLFSFDSSVSLYSQLDQYLNEKIPD